MTSKRSIYRASKVLTRPFMVYHDIEKRRSTKRQWRERNIDKARACARRGQHRYHIKKLYGMTGEEYNHLYNLRDGCCWICGRHQRALKKRLCVDHDQTTGLVRGLLCSQCNTALGLFRDDPEILKKAISYVYSFPRRL